MSTRWALGPALQRSDIPGLCAQLSALLQDSPTVVCDLSALREPDLVAVELMARMRLTARRAGGRVSFEGCGEALSDLVRLVGLDLQPRGQPEHGE